MRVLEDKLVKPNCFGLFFILPQLIVVSVFDLQSLSAATAGWWASCLFGSTALYPVAQKPRHRPMSEALTLLFREQNNVCSPHSAGVEWLQRTCLPYQCFNGEMWESIDGAVCWILAFFMWDLKAPEERLHSSPVTLWQAAHIKTALPHPSSHNQYCECPARHLSGVSLVSYCHIGDRAYQRNAQHSLFPLWCYWIRLTSMA